MIHELLGGDEGQRIGFHRKTFFVYQPVISNRHRDPSMSRFLSMSTDLVRDSSTMLPTASSLS